MLPTQQFLLQGQLETVDASLCDVVVAAVEGRRVEDVDDQIAYIGAIQRGFQAGLFRQLAAPLQLVTLGALRL
ncbi:hypothetical protein D3C81_1945710 [compost metagenome]